MYVIIISYLGGKEKTCLPLRFQTYYRKRPGLKMLMCMELKFRVCFDGPRAVVAKGLIMGNVS